MNNVNENKSKELELIRHYIKDLSFENPQDINPNKSIQNDNFEISTNINESGSSGTAFFVSKKGHLLTNNHVVKGRKLSKIIY